MLYPLFLYKRRRVVLFSVLSLAVLPYSYSAHAYSESIISNPLTGKPFLVYKVYDRGETFGENEVSAYTLSSTDKEAFMQTGNYWAEILGPGSKNAKPVYIAVGTFNEMNANALSEVMVAGPRPGLTALAGGFIDNMAESQDPTDPAGIIHYGFPTTHISSVQPSQLPAGGYADSEIVSTMIHEMGHALGVTSTGTQQEGAWVFEDVLSKWDEHLYDQNGNKATSGASIITSEDQRTGPTDFLVKPSLTAGELYGGSAYFSGKNVDEVLQGALLANPKDPNSMRMPGIPINGWESDAEGNLIFEGAHIELANNSMSHQSYRNYRVWTEAELAILQDIGYTIDRKNFFGYSVYSDGQTITNNNGYFARNTDGTAYESGVSNTASYGLGLHIYGSDNTITQVADLLANGVAGVGARVDGAGNTLTIASGVQVHGDGAYGTGLLVAYGKDHSIIHRGDLSATGLEGIAARFDFGDNLVGNSAEYRGSYIRVYGKEGSETKLHDLDKNNLNGPLVSRFDVTGKLAGSLAAIFIGPNALVKDINIMQGSSLSGDITSKWDLTDKRIEYSGSPENLVTNLNFGYTPTTNGSASATADSNFALRYDGNIAGATSMRLMNVGGALSYNGQAKLLSVTNNAGATLSGNGVYTLTNAGFGGLNDVGTFTNSGVLSPGNSIGTITVNGDYRQTSTGLLDMEFAANGDSDKLIVNGDATFDGGLQFRPMQGYYPSGQGLLLSTDNILQVDGTTVRSFDKSNVSLLSSSPTLSMTLVPNGSDYIVSVSRAANAYSQYAGGNYNGEQAGSALSVVANSATGDMQNLFTTLDFSSAKAINAALPQLSSAVYDAASRASLDNNRMISSLLNGNMLRAMQDKDQRSGESSVFVIPFASTAHQSSGADALGYTNNGVGILGGVERNWESGLTAGVHAVFSHNNFDGKTQAGATNKVDGLHFGVHGIFKPDVSGGWYTFGQLRAGIENNDMERKVSFEGYSRSNESKWHSFVGAAQWGGGYDVDLGSVVVGPIANLDYNLIARPSIKEKSGEATRLHLESSTMHSLGSNLGAKMSFTANTDTGSKFVFDTTVAWRHELLDGTQKSKASFVGYGNERFRSQDKLQGKDSMNVQGRVSFVATDTFSVSAQAGGEFFRSGYSSANGNLSFVWNF